MTSSSAPLTARERLAPLYLFGGELGAAAFVVIAVVAKRRQQRRPV